MLASLGDANASANAISTAASHIKTDDKVLFMGCFLSFRFAALPSSADMDIAMQDTCATKSMLAVCWNIWHKVLTPGKDAMSSCDSGVEQADARRRWSNPVDATNDPAS